MFLLKYFNNKKFLEQFEYPTQEEARDAIQENDIWNDSTRYEIIDADTDEITDQDEFETNESMKSTMFPDEESEEGFDVDDFFDKD